MPRTTRDPYDVTVEEEGGTLTITNRTEYYERGDWNKYTVTFRHRSGRYAAVKLAARDSDHARYRASATLIAAAQRRPQTVEHPRDYTLQNTHQDRREEPTE